MSHNLIINNIKKIIKKLENCKQFVINGWNPDEYEETAIEYYNTSVSEIKLFLEKLGLDLEEVEYDCPILITDLDFPNVQNDITRSIHFLKALINHIKSFEVKESKSSIKKYKESFEIEGGLPFLKGKYKKEEK